MKKNIHIKKMLCLHILLFVLSTTGICSKLAAAEAIWSSRFIVYYIILIAVLGLYALGWQQIIKKIPLTVAYANKSVGIVWSIIWGYLVFHEKITIGKIVGAVFLVAGAVLYAYADEKEKM